MPNYIDLHLHSNYSEGALSRRELLKSAKRKGIKVLSLTDHNSLDGVAEMTALGKRNGVKVISGVEIYATFKDKDFHLLGYGFDVKNQELVKVLNGLREKRLKAIHSSLKALKKQGFQIDFPVFEKLKNKYPGLSQIINILEKDPFNKKIIQKDCCVKDSDVFAVINQYFSPQKAASLPETSIPMQKAIKLIKNAGGITVLAHPGNKLFWKDDRIILDLKNLGLDGLEVISPYHNWRQIQHYQSLAKKYKLIITGGSDFHSDLPGKNIIENQWDYFKVPYIIYTQLKKHL